MIRKRVGTLAAVLALATTAAACGSSGHAPTASSTGGSSGSSSSTNSGGTPVRGGTLTMLGTGDVDYMDPNISYYTTGYMGLRMWSRQLYTYPAIPGKTTQIVPDLATAMPTVSADGLTYKVTIRTGAMWNTTPPRQVTAADEVRGVQRTCNPAQSFGGMPDFESLIQGLTAYCTAFAKVSPTASAIAAFINSHPISGVSVDPTNPQTVIFKLTHPATYFPDQLAIPALSPAPVETLKYVPASATLAQHTISDGPYEIASYNPAHSITFVRNPAWRASSDPVRKAYVNQVDVNETGQQNTIQQQLQTNQPSADMEWDATVPTADIPGLIASHNPGLNLGPTFGTSPYMVFNLKSPNNGGALTNVKVRQAISYAIDRSALIQDDGGPQASPPLTHVLPPGLVGSQNFDLYPYNVTKAKQLLAGTPAAHGLTLKLLYQSAFDYQVKMFQTLQAELAPLGIKVVGDGVPSADFFTKYLEVPSVAAKGTWDLALTGWFPDWYGNGALSYFEPLFGGSPAFPPSGSDFGYYDDPKTDSLIQQASTAKSESVAAGLWAEADRQVMADAAIYPITTPNNPNFHATQVHNAVFVPNLANFDPTNVWLSK